MNFSMDMQCAVEENAEGFDSVKECNCIMKQAQGYLWI